MKEELEPIMMRLKNGIVALVDSVTDDDAPAYHKAQAEEEIEESLRLLANVILETKDGGTR